MEVQSNYQAAGLNDFSVKSARCTQWVCSGALVLPAGSPQYLHLHSLKWLALLLLLPVRKARHPTESARHSVVALNSWRTGLLATSHRTAAPLGSEIIVCVTLRRRQETVEL